VRTQSSAKYAGVNHGSFGWRKVLLRGLRRDVRTLSTHPPMQMPRLCVGRYAFRWQKCHRKSRGATFWRGMKSLLEIFPRASQDFLSVNRSGQGSELKPAVRNESVATVQREKEAPKCRILRIISYRTRTCDTDNLCPKWIIDALRYSNLIEDDTPEYIELQMRQEKVAHKAQERTQIEIEIP